jgi:predicted DsbA family dithiol-disulfide isomerase
MSEHSARTLAQEIQHELPDWHIDVRPAEKQDADSLGILAFPAFLLDGRILATGIPRKDWLLAKLREWERGKR